MRLKIQKEHEWNLSLYKLSTRTYILFVICRTFLNYRSDGRQVVDICGRRKSSVWVTQSVQVMIRQCLYRCSLTLVWHLLRRQKRLFLLLHCRIQDTIIVCLCKLYKSKFSIWRLFYSTFINLIRQVYVFVHHSYCSTKTSDTTRTYVKKRPV